MNIKSLLSIIFLSLLVFTNAMAAELPIEHFVKHGDHLDMKLSPDGKHIAARINAENGVNLVIIDTAKMQLVYHVRPENNDNIYSVDWVSNERIVYQYAEKTYRLDQAIPTGELYATNIDGSRHTVIFGWRAGEQQTGTNLKKRRETKASADIVSLLDDNEKSILIIEYPWTLTGNTFYDLRRSSPTISRLNVMTGAKRKIETVPFPGARVFATPNGEILYTRWTNKEGFGEAAYRKDNDSEWILMEGDDAAFLPVGLSSDAEKVYLTARVGEKGFTNLFELDIKSGEKTKLFDGLNADVVSFNWDNKTNRPAVAMSYPGSVEYHYPATLNRTGTLHKALRDAFGSQELHITSQSKDGRLLLVHVSSSVNPGEYYIFDTKTNGANFVLANRSWLDPRNMNAKKPIEFESSDGKQISGYLTMPNGADDSSKAPLIVLIHGGPHARDYDNFDWEVQLLANRGYAVLQVNFRGSSGLGSDYLEAGYRQWGTGMIQDIIYGTQHAIANYPIDKSRICSYGASYGGYAALMVAAKAPDLVKCTVGYVGVYDLTLMLKEGNVAERLYYGPAYLRRTLGNDLEQLASISPVNLAADIKAEVMLIHGEKDTQVPVEQSELMLKSFKAVGKDVPYLNFSNSGHGVVDEEGRKQLYTALVEFFDKNIGK